MTSPPLIEPSWIQVGPLIEFLMKWTEPSPKRQSTPPGWRDRVAAYEPESFPWSLQPSIWAGWLSQREPGLGGLEPGTRRTTDRADVVAVVEGQGPADARQGPRVVEGQPDGQKVLVSVGGEPRHVGTSTCVVVPDRPADVVGRSLQELRSDVGIARPVRERGDRIVMGPRPLVSMPNGDCTKQVAGQDRTRTPWP